MRFRSERLGPAWALALGVAIAVAGGSTPASAQVLGAAVQDVFRFESAMQATISGLGDVDGDGALDFAVTRAGIPTIYSGATALPLDFGDVPATSVLAMHDLGDIDGDPAGLADFIVVSNAGLTRVDAISSSTGRRLYVFAPNTLSAPTVRAIGDVDGDGVRDIASSSFFDQLIELHSGADGTLLVSAPVSFPSRVSDVGGINATPGDELLIQYQLPNPIFPVPIVPGAVAATVFTYDAGAGALVRMYDLQAPPGVGPSNPDACSHADLTGDGIVDFVTAYPTDAFNRGTLHAYDAATGARLFIHAGAAQSSLGQQLFCLDVEGILAVSDNRGQLHLMSAVGGAAFTTLHSLNHDAGAAGRLTLLGDMINDDGLNELGVVPGPQGASIVSLTTAVNLVGLSTSHTGFANTLSAPEATRQNGLVVNLTDAQPNARVDFWVGLYPALPVSFAGFRLFFDPAGPLVPFSRTTDASGAATLHVTNLNQPGLIGSVWSVHAAVLGTDSNNSPAVDVTHAAQITILR